MREQFFAIIRVPICGKSSRFNLRVEWDIRRNGLGLGYPLMFSEKTLDPVFLTLVLKDVLQNRRKSVIREYKFE